MKKLMIVSAALVAVTAQAGWGDLGKSAAKDATAATIRGLSGSKDSAKRESSRTEAKPVCDADKAERDKKMAMADKGRTTTTDTSSASASDITKIKDDAQYYAAFKDAILTADDAKKKSLFKRACEMNDENIVIEFLTAYPDQTSAVADKWYSKICFDHLEIKNSKFAELLIENMKGLALCRLDVVMFHAAKKLDATTRAKYLKIADDNLAAAKQDEDLLVVERYYVGMPVIDYVMRSLEEKHGWTKDADKAVDKLNGYADMDTEISLDDWKKEWKIKYLVFTSKERSKIFKTKGTMDGFVEFLKKYVDKSATMKDITVEGGWWIYLDDPHELKMSLNDNNGALNIYRQK